MRIWRIGLLLMLTVALVNCSDDTNPPLPDSGPDFSDDISIPDGPGTDIPKPCNLAIDTINGRAASTVLKLTEADDQDNKAAGIQITVEVTGTNLADGTDVFLNVTQLSPDPSVKAAANKATFSKVTIDALVTNLVIKAYVKDNKCSGDTVQLTVEPPPECFFISPKNNDTLTVNKTDVTLGTLNALSGTVILRLGTLPQGSPQKPGSNGQVVFKGIDLNKGTNDLQGEVTVGAVTRICKATVTVKTDKPSCSIESFTPAEVTISKTPPGKGLGIAQDASAATAGLQTTIIVKTDGDLVELFQGGTTSIGSEAASGGTATFSSKTLPDGNLSLTATCSDSSTKLTAVSPEYKIWVDSVEPEEVTDFSCAVSNNRAGEVTCTWTSVKDPGGAKASGLETYKMGYVKGALVTAANWASATALPDVTPVMAGNTHTVKITGLALASAYGFGVMPKDYVLNESSKGPFASTLLDVDYHEDVRQGAIVTGAKNWGQVMAAGDFDCDGHTDIAVGNPDSESGKGKVYIYQGTKNGLTSAPWKIFNGTVAGGNFGARVVALDNFDKDTDNCNDLAVLANHGGASNKAQVFVYLGRKSNFFDRDDVTTGLGAELIYELGSGAAATALLGTNLAGGDFDGDGASDLFIGHADTATATDSATMLVVYGDSTLTLMASGKAPKKVVLPGGAGVQITGGKHSEAFGASLSNAGALDTGAHGDVVIGAPSNGTSGAVYVVKGGARASTLPEEIKLTDARVIKIAGGSSNAKFGASVAFVGDMDNDQTNEFAVGDPGFSSSLGTVYIFNLKGSTTPSSVTDAIATVKNDLTGASSDKFGTALACSAMFAPTTGADLDKDSYADLVGTSETAGSTAVGAAFHIGGATALTALATSKATYTFSPTGTASFGATVILAEDIDNDGYVDVIVGDPGFSSGVGRFFAFH